MRRLKTYSNHECAPAEWRQTQDLTGGYELDKVISQNSNRDMAKRLQDHLVSEVAYQVKTGYNNGRIG